MRLKTMCVAVAAIALLAGLAMAADATGKWVAKVPGREGQTRDVTFNLMADGAKLTGDYTGMGGEARPITDGKVEGDTISFTSKVEFNNNTFVIKYTGKVAGDEIKFTSKREGGDAPAREFTAKRAK